MDGKVKATRRQLVFGAVIGVVALILVFALVALSITPVKYNFAVGEVAPATINASREVEDTVSTQAAIAEARAAVPPKYSVDPDITDQVLADISAYFDAMADMPETLKEGYIYAQISLHGGMYADYERSYDAASVKWEDVLTGDQVEYIRTTLKTPNIPDAAVWAVAAMTSEDIQMMRESVIASVTGALGNGISVEYLASAADGIRRDLESHYTSGELSYLASLPVEKYLVPNKVMDEEATKLAQDEAEANVAPIIYKQNQRVATENQVVTEAQFAVLQELGVVGGQETDYLLYVSMFVYMALAFILYAVYLFQFERELLADTRRLLMLAAVAVVTAVLAVPLARFDSRIIPAFLGTMLACVLISQRNALTFTVFLAFVTAPICSWNAGLFSVTSLTIVMATILGGAACVFSLRRPMHRTSLITAGLAAGAVGALVTALSELMGAAEPTFDRLMVSGGLALGSGLLAGILAIGTLPMWEAAFHASTPSKLLELSNPNHPLLKRLSLEAPGTYHHSILTANLAEAGADAIGASALLCRVGAYYHDVGKLKDPQFFAENQKGDNPHDRIDPRESAKIITGHVTYGLELGRRYKLPREVLSIIGQHHGSTQVAYFYHKALEAGMEPKAVQYRYPGTRPVTLEAAIVMLADCVEAAVRSMGDPGIEQIREMIGKLIRERYNDGQLDDTPLNRQDMNHIAQAFAGVYEGALHERVKYPGQE